MLLRVVLTDLPSKCTQSKGAGLVVFVLCDGSGERIASILETDGRGCSASSLSAALAVFDARWVGASGGE